MQRLHEYMVPSRFIRLDALPLTGAESSIAEYYFGASDHPPQIRLRPVSPVAAIHFLTGTARLFRFRSVTLEDSFDSRRLGNDYVPTGFKELKSGNIV